MVKVDDKYLFNLMEMTQELYELLKENPDLRQLLVKRLIEKQEENNNE